MDRYLTPPLSDKDIKVLQVGDRVRFSGTLYVARDAAHLRLVEALARGENIPFDLAGQVIYYMGPAPAQPGYSIGSAGPTSSYRMDEFLEPLLSAGLKGMIGKGPRSQKARDLMVQYSAIYFGAVGGLGALYARAILHTDICAYPDLGPEAVRKIEVKNFPTIVINDINGQDLFERGKRSYSRNKE